MSDALIVHILMTDEEDLEDGIFVGHVEGEKDLLERMPAADDFLEALAWASARSDRIYVTLSVLADSSRSFRYWAGTAPCPAHVDQLPGRLRRSDPWNAAET